MFNITLNIHSLKSIRNIIKWFLILGSLLMTLHCGFLIFGVNLIVINFIFGMSLLGYIVLLLSSYLLAFCNNIRYLLTYIFLVRCCNDYQIYFNFGDYLGVARIILTSLGTILIFKTLYDAYVKGDDSQTIERCC